ncbi:MAG TPA: hypothetical protein VL125_17100 [Pelobium sp.]|nr:hypothetical protein [Pelobium sp.]
MAGQCCSAEDQQAGSDATNINNIQAISNQLDTLYSLPSSANEQYFSVDKDVNNNYTPSAFNGGSQSNASGNVGPNLYTDFHNHPSGNPPSTQDIIRLGGVVGGLSPNQVASFTIAPDGTAYGLVVVDEAKLETFWNANNNAVDSNNGWNPNSNIGQEHSKVFNDFYDPPSVSYQEAYARATAFILKESGLILVKKDTNSTTFKKIGTNKETTGGTDTYKESDCN